MVFFKCTRLRKMMNEGDNLSTNKTFSSKLRKYYVLKRLLNGEHLSYQRLADNYLVSRSSIANDLVFIKQLLTNDNVLLKFDNSGTFIGGGEENKQKVIKRIIANLVREIQTNNELFQLFKHSGVRKLILHK